MKLIEPCCAERHVRELRNALGSGGSREIEGYGDLSLSEMLPAILTRYYETEMLIAAPSIPDQAAEAIATWMRRSIARMDGRGRLNYIARLTVVAGLSPEKSPMASRWLEENPFGDRLALVDVAQADTALLMPDFAITGPVNMCYGRHFTATATTVREDVDALWSKYSAIAAGTAVTDGDGHVEDGEPAREPQPQKQARPEEENVRREKRRVPLR